MLQRTSWLINHLVELLQARHHGGLAAAEHIVLPTLSIALAWLAAKLEREESQQPDERPKQNCLEAAGCYSCVHVILQLLHLHSKYPTS
jgi:hypothetical protein